MKNGLIFENDELIFYKDGEPYHAGAIKSDGDIYYIGKGGRAVKGVHIVHSEMTNNVLKRGTYTFGDDYKLIKGSYIAPKKPKKSKSKKSGQKKSRKSSSKENAFILWGAVAVIILLITFAAVTAILDRHNNDNDETSVPAESSASNEEITLPMFEQNVLLCSEQANRLYSGEITITEAIKSGDPYRPFVFEYELGTKSGKLVLSETPDLSNPKEFILPANGTSLSIDNLKTDTFYYYEVTVGEESYTGGFRTEKGTRFIKLTGVYNTRDIGGYVTLDGKTVKQGMIIRGTEMDGLVNTSYFLPTDQIEYISKEFGFVCDLDLRDNSVFSGNYRSRLGEDVKHSFYSSPMYGSIFSDNYKQAVKDIFSDLANPGNYPMYMHCTYGADRTGTIVFLLQGVLNMSEEDMRKEYQLTAFFNKDYADSNSIDVICAGLESYQGDTLQEKIEDYLINGVGVTQQELEAIRGILLEN